MVYDNEMSIYDCPIKGTTEIWNEWDNETAQYVPRWHRADDEVHIDGALITDPDARDLIEKMYEIKEPCVYAGSYTLHGYLRDGAKGEV